MCQCLLVVFSQNIPCRARSFFLEHQGVAITEQKTFEFTLAQLTVRTTEFKVQCTNMANETYFEGAVWTALVHRYQMQTAERCNFYLDEGTKEIYFMYKHPDHPSDHLEDDAI